jgi:hypothetical protein
LSVPSLDNHDFIEQELDLRRLKSVFSKLWVAGRPIPPRPQHQQLILRREIFITERMDMHLVWGSDRIFLKPIPPFLLEPSFWTDYLSCGEGCFCSINSNSDTQSSMQSCRRGPQACALGFLLSYASLISHESDFLIAQDKHLLPTEVEWSGWRTLVWQILAIEEIDRKIDPRFIYGELRLSRLNKIYMLSKHRLLQGYMPHWNQYSTFFGDNFTWVASATVYIAVVLTAMQVGLATSLAQTSSFQSAAYGFTIFSILAPLIATGLIILVFFFAFINNWVAALEYKRKRFSAVDM